MVYKETDAVYNTSVLASRSISFFVVLFFLVSCAQPSDKTEDKSSNWVSPHDLSEVQNIAVLGDSGATGVMADPRIHLSYSGLWKSIFKPHGYNKVKLDPFDALYEDFQITLPLAQNDYPNVWLKMDDVGEALELSFQDQLNFREMTWSFLMGRSRVQKAQDISMYAMNGKRVISLLDQVKVLKARERAQLPELTFVSFTANDFCAEDIFTPEGRLGRMTSYREDLQAGLKKLSQFETSQDYHSIVLLSPLPVTKILRSSKVAHKQIKLPLTGDVYCKDLRSSDPIPIAKTKLDYGEAIRNMCPSILSIAYDDEEKISYMEGVFDQAMRIQREVLEEVRHASTNDSIIFRYVPEVFDLEVDDADVANDCFHPSIYGHAKLAELLNNRL